MKKRMFRIVMLTLCTALPVMQGFSCLPNIVRQVT